MKTELFLKLVAGPGKGNGRPRLSASTQLVSEVRGALTGLKELCRGTEKEMSCTASTAPTPFWPGTAQSLA